MRILSLLPPSPQLFSASFGYVIAYPEFSLWECRTISFFLLSDRWDFPSRPPIVFLPPSPVTPLFICRAARNCYNTLRTVRQSILLSTPSLFPPSEVNSFPILFSPFSSFFFFVSIRRQDRPNFFFFSQDAPASNYGEVTLHLSTMRSLSPFLTSILPPWRRLHFPPPRLPLFPTSPSCDA